ncbi:TPA: hypothetical protein DIC20_04325 [Candidatus Dependentiae bacterium]|nr:MAG: hypothetical protein US03_C0004G0036 [candidate division TM6 bacterium GW2011_GWF2_36_131]KKQ03214.1 MAG: hypothetical protein US13_C0004G0036 [candidate division TM6 bacterium GW2011_GWE2_36_25]KKQ19000.1 MAG: hypothetical protein US32_C0018G0006 [candidate division TM6 bacterium GW2011_GWA2_36_9]HBR70356.1 hypothetical protein [Candidatus Dependentiae bacterium]HCU00901.1 hypothetical protein [Candidatus Dependentiae bacterium]
MNSLKNKGFCLLEIITGIAILLLGFLMVGGLVSQVSYYTLKARLLSEAANQAVIALEQRGVSHYVTHPYEIRVERSSGKKNIPFYRSIVSWDFSGKREEIVLVTCLIEGIRGD